MTARGTGRAIAVVAAMVAAVVLAAAALAGCSARSGAVGPRFELSEDPSPVTSPVGIRVLALPPGERVTITATTRPGALWSSQAVYAVPADGILDLARDAPLEAPFTGADGMGLFWTLRSASGAAATSGGTGADETWGGASLTVVLRAAIGGRSIASAAVHRTGLSALAPSRAVFDDGISGDFFAPVRSSEGLRPGVLVLDGTDPGTPTGVLTAAAISAMGYPALDLSTFGSSGQPEPVRTVPAERLVSAIGWLRAQPGVDDARIFVFGSSRGAQIALWAATEYPGLIYGVIAPAGTTGLVCPSPVPSPVVSVGGAWVPCVTGTHEVDAASVLDLGDVPGPVVLGCAGRDEVLSNGCEWQDAAAAKRPAREGDVYLRASGASHLFYVPPYTPLFLPQGPAAQPTERARVAFWAAVAGALSAPSTVPGH